MFCIEKLQNFFFFFLYIKTKLQKNVRVMLFQFFRKHHKYKKFDFFVLANSPTVAIFEIHEQSCWKPQHFVQLIVVVVPID